MKYRFRSCENPKFSNGGRDCVGTDIDSQLCNVEPCNPGKFPICFIITFVS